MQSIPMRSIPIGLVNRYGTARTITGSTTDIIAISTARAGNADGVVGADGVMSVCTHNQRLDKLQLRHSIRCSQEGIGLIEVMVALLLLAVAVLGYTALQGQAIKATDESFERTQSLVMMRSIAEKIRANPTAIETYETQLNATTNTPPAQKCGLDGAAVTTQCTATQIANAESYYAREEMDRYDFAIQLHPCPNTGGTGTNAASNIMYSYCLLAAWGDTTPTIGTDADVNCLEERVTNDDGEVTTAGGSYHPRATCMMMEL